MTYHPRGLSDWMPRIVADERCHRDVLVLSTDRSVVARRFDPDWLSPDELDAMYDVDSGDA
jgi:hypothetical protein